MPTECKEQDPNNTFVGHCVGLFNSPIQDKFNFSLPDKRYGISFLITITDEAYNATDDNGMQVRVYDQCKRFDIINVYSFFKIDITF